MAANADSGNLLESVIKTHGGLDRWRRVQKVVVTYHFHGATLDHKGFPGIREPNTTVSTTGEPTTVVTKLGDGQSTDRWVFTPNRVWIESADGKLIQERFDPRSAFEDHTYATKWDDLNLTYFLGYATYNYLTIPWIFTSPGFETAEIEPHTEMGETWRVLKVTHPDGFATHTKVQKFYFGSRDFLLKRMDYTADVVKGVAAHYVFDYKSIGGLLFPTQRRVVQRVDDQPKFSRHTAFWLNYLKLEVVDQDGTVHSEAERIISE